MVESGGGDGGFNKVHSSRNDAMDHEHRFVHVVELTQRGVGQAGRVGDDVETPLGCSRDHIEAR